MDSIKDLQQQVVTFRNQRNWQEYDLPKNLIISLWVEIGELAEHFQYWSDQEILEKIAVKREEVADELIDVLWWILLIAHEFKIDLSQEFLRKMHKNIRSDKKKGYQKVKLSMPTEIESFAQMSELIQQFRQQRNWGSNDHPRDILLKMFEEMGELAEHFQWKSLAQIETYLNSSKEDVADELVDVLICDLLLFSHLKYNLGVEFVRKLAKNQIKYPL